MHALPWQFLSIRFLSARGALDKVAAGRVLRIEMKGGEHLVAPTTILLELQFGASLARFPHHNQKVDAIFYGEGKRWIRGGGARITDVDNFGCHAVRSCEFERYARTGRAHKVLFTSRTQSEITSHANSPLTFNSY